MSPISDVELFYLGLLLFVLAIALWPSAGALLVVIGAALTLWEG